MSWPVMRAHGIVESVLGKRNYCRPVVAFPTVTGNPCLVLAESNAGALVTQTPSQERHTARFVKDVRVQLPAVQCRRRACPSPVAGHRGARLGHNPIQVVAASPTLCVHVTMITIPYHLCYKCERPLAASTTGFLTYSVHLGATCVYSIGSRRRRGSCNKFLALPEHVEPRFCHFLVHIAVPGFLHLY
ncbi:hypothetical protein BC834DRAFT_413975 [Gloeopeniophorella convolvens]|nr:hypothetical protein BC834DRAFT_413975 [Gloeopeniophorella convolvens]